jgi:sugar lactone lactonase YvrE
VVSTQFGSGNAAFPVAVAADSSHGLWLANQGDTTVTHVDQNGNVLAHPNCCSGANGIAIDVSGNAWVSNYYGGNVTEVSPTGAIATLVDGGQDGGLGNGYPSGIALDAAQNVWVALYRGTGFSELVGNSGYQAPGTALSPVNGYGLDANLLLPFTLIPDASGNIWIANYGNSNLVMFFGMAAPTATPLTTYPMAP